MPDKPDRSAEAFRELIRVLEEALRVGADSVGLEYEDRELVLYYYCGNTGIGASDIPLALENEVLEELVRRAGLTRRTKGKMQLSLLGKDYEVLVNSYQDFDEWCYRLTLREHKLK